jgi:hypothetical protein
MILAGAPDNASLDWNSNGLLDVFSDPIAQFIGLNKPTKTNATNIPYDSVLDIATWRSIPLERARLETGFSQAHAFDGYYQASQDFFTMAETQGADATSLSLRDEFYEHTLRVHDEIHSSQLPSDSFSSVHTSFGESTDDESYDVSMEDTTIVTDGNCTLGLGTTHLSDLEDLPNAAYLQSIVPQTMTVNLIVGVISVAEPRVVRTRWGTPKSLVELLVGDETKSGFSVTFWLSHDSNSATDKELKTLRRQDIVLLRNVALSSFKQKVHGHSLRKNLTKIDLLYRRKLDDDDVGGFYTARDLASRKRKHPQLLKTQRVREWVLKFVGGDVGQLGKRKAKGRAVRSWELPPPDSQ